VDERPGSGNAEGQLRFVAAVGEFEYEFPSPTGTCFVRGRLQDASTIRFGREGSCPAEVLESVLTLQGRNAHSYTYANGVLAIDFTRADP
jgi:hypothetical protein